MADIGAFREIVVADFEFSAPPGERPKPVCMVAREIRSGRVHRLFEDELRVRRHPPYPTDLGCVFVAYYAAAELACHLALGWDLPSRILDLYVEFRNKTNGLTTPCGDSLLGALAYHGLPAIEVTEKDSMRQLALRGGPWTPEESAALFDYCQTDVDSTERLLAKMLPSIDLPRALLRGRYMAAVARMEYTGVPIDVKTLRRLRDNWEIIKVMLIERVDRDFGVFDGTTFKRDLWTEWLAEARVPWPRLPSGQLALDDNSFRIMARRFPQIEPIRQLRVTLSQLRLEELAVGSDGRNRAMLSAFRSKTGRNQPSNSKFIFGPSAWLRGLVKPLPGYGLAYLDWSQQEFGIAAALSDDEAMIRAYESGDPYLECAKQAGAAPAGATKYTHAEVREQFKACILGVQFGMGEETLAARIGQCRGEARELLRAHRETYQTFWRWSQAAVDHAMLNGRIWTRFGWNIHAGQSTNPRTLRNFPMQANGAEILRLACCLATERGIRVSAPIHDAVLIEAPIDDLDETVVQARACMSEASRTVLDGFELRSGATLIRYPDRFQDERGEEMWNRVQQILSERCVELGHVTCPTAAQQLVPTRDTRPVLSI